MEVTELYNGCVVKFDGNTEPCVVYRVLDATPVYIEFSQGMVVPQVMPHVKIEVIGLVPTSLLRKATQHHKNMFALDKALHMDDRCN